MKENTRCGAKGVNGIIPKQYCEAYGEDRRLEKSQGWTCPELRPQ